MKGKFIAAGAAAIVVIGGGAWASFGSATASTVRPSSHGWPNSSSTASAAKVIAAAKAEAASTGSKTLLIRAREVSFADVDVNNDGFGPGDYFLFQEDIRYLDSNKVIGRDSVRCTVGPSTFICDGTIEQFGKGKIVIYGAVFERRDSRYAVTGGTGDYEGVGGQLDTVNMRGGDTLLAFEIAR